MSDRIYETTILVNAAQARADHEGTLAAVRRAYEEEGAEFVEFEPWEERRLAYPIAGQTSALYLFGYFRADAAAVERIERRCRLTDVVLRQLIIVREGRDYDRIRAQREKQRSRVEAEA